MHERDGNSETSIANKVFFITNRIELAKQIVENDITDSFVCSLFSTYYKLIFSIYSLFGWLDRSGRNYGARFLDRL